jgi:hypothetical protein
MGKVCSTNVGGVYRGFQKENMKERDNWLDIDVVGRIILVYRLEK